MDSDACFNVHQRVTFMFVVIELLPTSDADTFPDRMNRLSHVIHRDGDDSLMRSDDLILKFSL